MAEYEVILEREITEEGYVMVEAESAEEAKSKAQKLPAGEIAWDRVNTGDHFATGTEEEKK